MVITVVVLCLAAGLSFLYQLLHYLRRGEWLSVSVLEPFRTWWPELLPGFTEWAWAPRDWIGLHSILNSINLSIGLILIAISVACCVKSAK